MRATPFKTIQPTENKYIIPFDIFLKKLTKQKNPDETRQDSYNVDFFS